MRKLFLQIALSVDGYFDGPNQELDWFVLDDEFFAYVEAMLGSIDGILLGRTTYEGFAAHWPNSTQAEAAGMNTLPKFVASTTLTNATWSNTTIIADDVPNAVARMKKEPGKDIAHHRKLAPGVNAGRARADRRVPVLRRPGHPRPGQASPRRLARTARR